MTLTRPFTISNDKFPKPHAVVYDGQFLAYSTDRLFKTGTSKGTLLTQSYNMYRVRPFN